MATGELARAILQHFDAHRRALPWRETSDPYAIWISEVMLQQTRVDAVVPYYRRWIGRFPTVEALAEAELDDVLREWQGLGYYSRARNLHAAARMVRERHRGAVPGDAKSLRELPGVGEYTAGAIASIAFGEATPAVDGNVRRVLARLYDLEEPTSAELRQLATDLVPADRPGDFNQALMELGATVCTPRSPDCVSCPVADWCRARAQGVQALRPRPKRQRPLPEEEVRTLVLVDGERLLLVRRPANGLLGGLWEFPPERLARDLGIAGDALGQSTDLPAVRQVFSHKAVTYRPRLTRGDGTAAWLGAASDRAWATLEGLSSFALPVAQQRIAALVPTALESTSSNAPPSCR